MPLFTWHKRAMAIDLAYTRETGFLDRTLLCQEREYRYQLFRPRCERPAQGLPLILFLHGAGERGRDGLLQTQVGLGAAIRTQSDRFPCVALFPQISGGRYWNRLDMAEMVMQCLRKTCEEEAVDRRRVYLTGISMGGAGVWYLGARHPGTFAALIPVCGGVRYPAASSGDPGSDENRVMYLALAESIASTPVWAFHGALDTVVNPGFSRGMAAALTALGCPPHYTEYPDGGHDAWNLAYAEPALWDWVFHQYNVG